MAFEGSPLTERDGDPFLVARASNSEGAWDGGAVGIADGLVVGTGEDFVGDGDGSELGTLVGVGSLVGRGLGSKVGLKVGALVPRQLRPCSVGWGNDAVVVGATMR